MKALTICQPYAELVLRPEKPVENRPWYSSYRGPLLIHAGKNRKWQDFYEAAVRSGSMPGPKEPLPAEMVFGAIVGIVEMIDCIKLEAVGEEMKYFNRHYRTWTITRKFENYRWLLTHPHASGPFCFIFKDPRRFVEPIPFLGKQGLFDIPDGVVREALETARS
jgi:hypothetical protein